MSENMVVRIIFEPKREEVIGDWRNSRNEEFIISKFFCLSTDAQFELS